MVENVFVVMPAYNAAGTIEHVFERIPEAAKKRISRYVVVDDGSTDDTRAALVRIEKVFLNLSFSPIPLTVDTVQRRKRFSDTRLKKKLTLRSCCIPMGSIHLRRFLICWSLLIEMQRIWFKGPECWEVAPYGGACRFISIFPTGF